jgi:hypothetical protein
MAEGRPGLAMRLPPRWQQVPSGTVQTRSVKLPLRLQDSQIMSATVRPAGMNGSTCSV